MRPRELLNRRFEHGLDRSGRIHTDIRNYAFRVFENHKYAVPYIRVDPFQSVESVLKIWG